jgi:molybdate transport system substrate-binding protein
VRKFSAVLLAMLTMFVASACSGGVQPITLTVFGAASLKSALDQIKAQYEASHAGTTLTISTDSSSALRTQIEQGAPADLFLSADSTNPLTLADAGKTDGAPEPFTSNSLTIIVPQGNPANVTSPADLARPGVKVVAAGDEVPITKYANQAVTNLAGLPGYPPGFAESYAANIVSKEQNVGAVTAKVSIGEGDAAIVYVTDAKTANLPVVDIPAEANVVASYNGAVIKGANQTAAHTLLDWIQGTVGQKILADLGFQPPAP